MERIFTKRSVLWLLIVVALSAVTSYTVSILTIPGSGSVHHGEQPSGSFHHWMHENLEITPEQEARLLPIESVYENKEAELKARIRSAGSVLAHALEDDATDNPRFEKALNEIQVAQGELQRLTLEHFLDMKEHLSPEQAERLLRWTHDSIAHEHSH